MISDTHRLQAVIYKLTHSWCSVYLTTNVTAVAVYSNYTQSSWSLNIVQEKTTTMTKQKHAKQESNGVKIHKEQFCIRKKKRTHTHFHIE